MPPPKVELYAAIRRKAIELTCEVIEQASKNSSLAVLTTGAAPGLYAA
jgi:hypothetical protein